MSRIKIIRANLFLLFYALSFFAYINVRILDLVDYMLMTKTLMYSFLFCWYIVKTTKVNNLFILVASIFALSDLINNYFSIDAKHVVGLFFLANTSLVYLLTNKVKNSVKMEPKIVMGIHGATILFSIVFLIGLTLSKLTILMIFFSLTLLLLFFIVLYYYKTEVKESSFLMLAGISVLIICYSFATLDLFVVKYINYVIIQIVSYGLFLFLITKSLILEDKYYVNSTTEERIFLNKNLSIIFFIVFSIIYTYLRVEDNTSFIMHLTKSFLIVVMFLYYINIRIASYSNFFLILSVLHLVGGNVFVRTDEASFMQGVGFYFFVNVVLIYMVTKKIGIITTKDLLHYFLPVFILSSLIVYLVFGNTEEQLIIYTFTFTLSILVSITLKYLLANRNRLSKQLFLSILSLVLCYIFATWVRLIETNFLFVFLEAVLYCLELYFLTEFFITENKELSTKEDPVKTNKIYVYKNKIV